MVNLESILIGALLFGKITEQLLTIKTGTFITTGDTTIDMDIVATRRKRLRELIDTSYQGLLVSFVQRTGINPSELSGLLRNKSFGEKKARLIEVKAGLPFMYLDMQDDTHLLVHQIMEIVYKLSEEEQKLVLAFCQMASKKKNSSLDENTDNRQRRRRMQNVPVDPSENKRKNPGRRKDEDNNSIHH